MATWLEAQFGFAEETTWGTRVTPTRFLPFNSESIKTELDYIESTAYRAGRKTQTVRRPNFKRVAGDIELELTQADVGLLMKHMFGSVSTTGSSPYVHTFTPGALLGKGLTIQMGRTSTDGTTRPFDYTGCKIAEWELTTKVGELAMLKCSVVGKTEDTGQSLASASYDSVLSPFSWVDGSVTIGGTATPLKELTITGNNGLLTDRFRIQSTTPTLTLEPQEAAVRQYGGTLVADFADLTAYNRFINQTAATLIVTLSAGASASLVITMNVEFDGETPNATGIGDELVQNLPFTALHGTADSSTVTFTLTNLDSSP
jgi:hypothetical protein